MIKIFKKNDNPSHSQKIDLEPWLPYRREDENNFCSPNETRVRLRRAALPPKFTGLSDEEVQQGLGKFAKKLNNTEVVLVRAVYEWKHLPVNDKVRVTELLHKMYPDAAPSERKSDIEKLLDTEPAELFRPNVTFALMHHIAGLDQMAAHARNRVMGMMENGEVNLPNTNIDEIAEHQKAFLEDYRTKNS